jgi:hypothetical protein
MGYYIADVSYDPGGKIEELTIGYASDEYPEMNTYSPSEYTFHEFKGLQYAGGKWYKETSGKVNVYESASKFKNIREARLFVIKMIFFEEEESEE